MATRTLDDIADAIAAKGTFTEAFVYDTVHEIPGYQTQRADDDRDPVEYAAAEFGRLRGVTAEITAYEGLSGGWPDVTFTGPADAIRSLWVNDYGFTAENGFTADDFDWV